MARISMKDEGRCINDIVQLQFYWSAVKGSVVHLDGKLLKNIVTKKMERLPVEVRPKK